MPTLLRQIATRRLRRSPRTITTTPPPTTLAGLNAALIEADLAHRTAATHLGRLCTEAEKSIHLLPANRHRREHTDPLPLAFTDYKQTGERRDQAWARLITHLITKQEGEV